MSCVRTPPRPSRRLWKRRRNPRSSCRGALMHDRQVHATLFDAVLVASTGSVESGVVPLRSAERGEALLVQATSVAGTADIKIEFAISRNGVDFGSYDDYTDLVASSATEFQTDEGLTSVPLPNMLTTFVKFKVTGVGSNPADTLVTA